MNNVARIREAQAVDSSLPTMVIGSITLRACHCTGFRQLDEGSDAEAKKQRERTECRSEMSIESPMPPTTIRYR